MSLASPSNFAPPDPAAPKTGGREWPGIREWLNRPIGSRGLTHGGRLGALRLFFSKPGGLIGFVLLAAIVAVALCANWIYPGDPLDTVAEPFLWPGQNLAYPLGTDSLGRNVAAAVVHGSRTSLTVGFTAATVGLAVGVFLGSIAGYFGGWVDGAVMRVTELFQTTPMFLFIVVLVALLQPTAGMISLAIGLTTWEQLARLVRAEVRQLLQSDFVLAARSTGFGSAHIIVREILPNVLPSIVVMVSFKVASAIFMESSLAFLGLGDPNHVSWGGMIEEGRDFIRTAWYLTIIPGAAIVAAVLSLNLIGDALNDALNPRLRRTA